MTVFESCTAYSPALALGNGTGPGSIVQPSRFPVQYLGANVPQAWAASSVFALLQSVLGVEQDAPGGVLWVDPTLPAWLPDITLMDIPLGERHFSIRFERTGTGTTSKVLEGSPEMVRQRRFMNP